MLQSSTIELSQQIADRFQHIHFTDACLKTRMMMHLIFFDHVPQPRHPGTKLSEKMAQHIASSDGIEPSKVILPSSTPSNAEHSWISQILLWLVLFHWICISSADAFSLVPNLNLIPISLTYTKLQAAKNPTSKRSQQLTNLVDWSNKNIIK